MVLQLQRHSHIAVYSKALWIINYMYYDPENRSLTAGSQRYCDSLHNL